MNKFHNLGLRLLVGFAGAFVIIFSIVYSPWTFMAAYSIMGLLTLNEYWKLVVKDDFKPLRFYGLVVFEVLFLSVFCIKIGYFDNNILIFSPIFIIIPFFIKLYDPHDPRPFLGLGLHFLGLLYVGLPFILTSVIAFYDGYIFGIMTGVMCLTWATDVGSYFVGSYFGKTKLFERISPFKTWEGLIGGSLFSLFIAWCCFTIFGDLPLWKWLVMSMIISTMGIYGDLIESHFKRTIALKDSGASIPGHGGFLDRFDSFIINVPFVIFFLEITR